MKKLSELGISPTPWHFSDGKIRSKALGTVAYYSELGKPERVIANANILAAAPDLYDALQQIMHCWGVSVFDEGGMMCDTQLYCKHAGCRPETCPVFLRAKSALAKAAGEENANGN